MRALAKQAPRTAGGLHQLPCSSEWRRTPVKAPAGAEGPAEATAGEVGGQPGHAPGERPFEGREVARPLEPRVALAAGPARAPDSHLCPKSTGLVSFPSCPWGSRSVRNHVGRGPTIQGQEGCRPPPLTRALAPPPAHPRIPGWTTQQSTGLQAAAPGAPGSRLTDRPRNPSSLPPRLSFESHQHFTSLRGAPSFTLRPSEQSTVWLWF